jgi:hypothetical protein
MYSHCGEDFLDALIDTASDICGVLNAIGRIPEYLLVSRNQEDRVVVGFTKWRESFVRFSVCGVQVN